MVDAQFIFLESYQKLWKFMQRFIFKWFFCDMTPRSKIHKIDFGCLTLWLPSLNLSIMCKRKFLCHWRVIEWYCFPKWSTQLPIKAQIVFTVYLWKWLNNHMINFQPIWKKCTNALKKISKSGKNNQWSLNLLRAFIKHLKIVISCNERK